MTSPHPLHLPAPGLLEQGPRHDHEVRAWVDAAQNEIEGLRQALVAATARAEHAERLLAEARSATSANPLCPPGRDLDSAGPRSSVAEVQARFEAATVAASTWMTEARAILIEAREGLIPPDSQRRDSPTPSPLLSLSSPCVADRSWASRGPDESVKAASAPPAAQAPTTAAPPAWAPAHTRPAVPRPGPADRRMATGRPLPSGTDPSTVLPPRIPSRRSRPGLATLFGRHHRTHERRPPSS